MDEKKIAKMMKSLGCSREEAIEVMRDDEAIDKGENLFELTAEQKKVEKKMRQADRTPTVYKFTKRERKPNQTKRDLMQLLQNALIDFGATDMEVTNIERQLDFAVDGVRYRVVLSAPRK